MTPESYREAVRRAAASGDWAWVERASALYGWSLLAQAMHRGMAWLAARLAATEPWRRRF